MPVLVGFVPTPEGRAALRRAVLECRLRDMRLIVVNSEYPAAAVTGPGPAQSTAAGAGSEVPGSEVAGSEVTGSGPSELDPSAIELRTACAELGVPEPEFEVHRMKNAYEPADQVLEVAEQSGADLIVIGLRRRTAVGKLILGGSAQRILLDASCPVLTVKVDQRVESWPRPAGAVQERV